MGSETFLDYSRLHVGSVLPRDILVPRVKNFVGYVSQLKFNGVDYFDRYFLVLSCFMIFIISKICQAAIFRFPKKSNAEAIVSSRGYPV